MGQKDGTVGPSGSYVPTGRKLCRGFPRELGIKPAPGLWLVLQMGDPMILWGPSPSPSSPTR